MTDATVRQIIREAMDKTEWRDKVRAKELIWRSIKARANAEELIEECAKHGISELVDELWRSQEVPANVERDAPKAQARLLSTRRNAGEEGYERAVNERAREWLLDERIADGRGGGLIVREATKIQIEEYASKLVSMGQMTLKRGHYFTAVAELLKKGSDVVGAVLTENDLQRMWTKQGLPLRKAGAA